MSPHQIVISVSGGLVQDVFCCDPHGSLTVVDWDIEGCSPAEPGIVKVPLEQSPHFGLGRRVRSGAFGGPGWLRRRKGPPSGWHSTDPALGWSVPLRLHLTRKPDAPDQQSISPPIFSRSHLNEYSA